MHVPLKHLYNPRLGSAGIRGISLGMLGALVIALTSAAWHLSAQQGPPNHFIYVNVTDSANRFVAGLEQEQFGVMENGAPSPITSFLSVDTPISIAIVTAEPLDEASNINERAFRHLLKNTDELIAARSLSEALRQLSTSKNPRKTVILAVDAEVDQPQSPPGGPQLVRTDLNTLMKTVIEVRNQYVLGISSLHPSARIEVALRQPRGLPMLKPTWK